MKEKKKFVPNKINLSKDEVKEDLANLELMLKGSLTLHPGLFKTDAIKQAVELYEDYEKNIAEEELKALKEDLKEEYEYKIETLESQYQDLEDEKEKMEDDYEDQISALESEIEDLKEEIRELEENNE